MKKRLFFVKREVLATSITDAMRRKGRVYEVSEAAESQQPAEEKPMGINTT